MDLLTGFGLATAAGLLIVEVVADRVPALGSVNDVVQTIARPTAGGIVFGSETTPADPFTAASRLGLRIDGQVHRTRLWFS